MRTTHTLRRRATIRLATGLLLALATSFSTTAALAQEDVVPTAELTTLPSLKSPEAAAQAIQRTYPAQLQSRGIGGTALLQVIIEPNGRVEKSSIQVVAATIRRLGEAAKKAVEQIEFIPGTVDGRPVRTAIEFPVSYRVR